MILAPGARGVAQNLPDDYPNHCNQSIVRARPGAARRQLVTPDGNAGSSRRARAQGVRHEDLQANLAAIDPRLARWADGFVFGDVWAEPGLTFEDRQLVAIVALAATGKPDQLRNYLHGAIQDGFDPVRVHEALVMLVVYVGFPTALQSLLVWQEVVRSVRRRGGVVEVPIQ
jgi:4-carboxymuconolactone decarboxylase